MQSQQGEHVFLVNTIYHRKGTLRLAFVSSPNSIHTVVQISTSGAACANLDCLFPPRQAFKLGTYWVTFYL